MGHRGGPTGEGDGGASGHDGSGSGGTVLSGGWAGGSIGGFGGVGGVGGVGGFAGSGGTVASGGRVRRGTGGTGGINRTGGTVVGVGGRSSSGGTTVSGGTLGFGGLPTGGSSGGGAGGAGGTFVTGGTVGAGGQIPTGGQSGTGGSGGAIAAGGSIGAGGLVLLGGTINAGGMPGSGGVTTGGTTGQGGATVVPLTCGDGIIDPGEQCDLGADNKDAPAFLVTQAGRSFAATPLVRDVTCTEFYDYRSASSHTGLEELGVSRILFHLYRPDFGLSLIFFHGVDEDSTGLQQPDSGVYMDFSGLPDTTFVAVVDDDVRDELWMESTPGTATGWWNFKNNTDGGAFSGLPFPGDWKIELKPTFAKGISLWTWVQSDVSNVDLDLAAELTIEAHSSPSQCRTNCTIPYCGDGILDGGELCDPGVPTGYYCSDDCQSFY
jgi:hypothetical protein